MKSFLGDMVLAVLGFIYTSLAIIFLIGTMIVIFGGPH